MKSLKEQLGDIRAALRKPSHGKSADRVAPHGAFQPPASWLAAVPPNRRALRDRTRDLRLRIPLHRPLVLDATVAFVARPRFALRRPRVSTMARWCPSAPTSTLAAP